MKRIKQYNTVADCLEELDRKVNDAIKLGWQPLGAPVLIVGGKTFVQALVKYED